MIPDRGLYHSLLLLALTLYKCYVCPQYQVMYCIDFLILPLLYERKVMAPKPFKILAIWGLFFFLMDSVYILH